MAYIIAYDIGTTGNKTCLYETAFGKVNLLASASGGYGLTLLPNGGVEQDPDDWWNCMCKTTREALSAASVSPEQVTGVSFCSQMQCLVLVDGSGRHIRPAMSYMDKRAFSEYEAWRKGPAQIAGVTLPKLLTSLMETGVVAASGKDPVFRYAWVREHEPAVYARIYKWLDAKEALISRATGECVMSEDSAFATMLYSPKHHCWSKKTAALHRVKMEHLPRIVRSTDPVGKLTKRAAEELGLTENAVVYAGGGDSSLIGVGCGAGAPGKTHVYIGTSGWVSTVVEKQLVDVVAMIASVVGAEHGQYNYFAEMETAGKCLEWARDEIVLDGLGVYPEKRDVMEAGKARSVLSYLDDVVATVPAGAGGVVFTPWLLGNRCPFEDANCRSVFFGVGLGTKKAELVRAVYEGVLYHLRWMLEQEARKVGTSDTVRIAGGGARSDTFCQMLSDVLGRPVERVRDPQNAGALGACLVAAVGMGLVPSLSGASAELPVEKRYAPNPRVRGAYEKNYGVFLRLYQCNRKNFARMHAGASAVPDEL